MRQYAKSNCNIQVPYLLYINNLAWFQPKVLAACEALYSAACVSLFGREAQAQRGLPVGLPETQAERLHVKGGQNLIETDRPPPASGNPETGGGAGGYKNRGNHQPFGELAVDLYIRSGTPLHISGFARDAR